MEPCEAGFLIRHNNLPKPPPEGDYFQTHGILDGTVTRRREFDVSKKGYRGATKKVEVLEITTPIIYNTEDGEVIIRAVNYDFPQTPESLKKPKTYTVVFLPGGAGEAIGNVDWIANIKDNLAPFKDQLPFNIKNIVILPHIAGSPRKKSKNDPAKQDTMSESAKIQAQVLENKELKVSSGGIIIIGYSYGGLQGIELAALLGEKCKYLILLDPAGMARHEKLLWRFSGGTMLATLKKHCQKHWEKDKNMFKFLPKGFIDAIKDADREIRIAWGSVSAKLPDVFDMLNDLRGKNVWVEEVARAYGLEDEYAGTGPNPKPAQVDSTATARQNITASIIFSPVEGANVVNVIVSKMKEIYPTAEAVLKASKDETERRKLEYNVLRLLKEMYPKAQALFYAGFPDTTHSAVRAEKEYLARVFTVFKEAACFQISS